MWAHVGWQVKPGQRSSGTNGDGGPVGAAVGKGARRSARVRNMLDRLPGGGGPQAGLGWRPSTVAMGLAEFNIQTIFF
jgi:hypothetical protein